MLQNASLFLLPPLSYYGSGDMLMHVLLPALQHQVSFSSLSVVLVFFVNVVRIPGRKT